MATWKKVKERWLPIVEKMEEHGMDDYAIPEIYRAAEREIEKVVARNTDLTEVLEIAFRGNITNEEAELIVKTIHKHKGD